MRCRMHRMTCLVLLVLMAAACSAAAQPTPEPVASVVLRFHNGSIIQPGILLDAIEVETKVGKVTIPAAEVRKIDFGFRVSDDDTKKIEQALRDLASDKFAAREAATKLLMDMGRLAYPDVVASVKGADLETAKRLDTILKHIRARNSVERLQTRRTDIVKTTDCTVTGKILATSLRVKCELFGEVKIPMWHLRELRSLQPGGDVIVALDAGKYGNKTSWMETDFDVVLGTRLEITASGEINLDPNNQLNIQFARNVRPEGTAQLTSNEGYLPGQVLGRIGTDGPIFVIGNRYSAPTTREGKLYVRCVTIEHANGIKAGGTYTIKITAEQN